MVKIDEKFKVMRSDIDFEFVMYIKDIEILLQFVDFLLCCVEKVEYIYKFD